MINNYNKFILISLILISLFPGKADARYQVSGLVEFSYRDYETKIGGQKASSYHTFTQTYNANIVTPILDPRLLILQGNVGYTKSASSGGVMGSNGLTYGVNAAFFSRSKISAELYGNKTITTVQGNSSVAGYDVNTMSYGGTLNLRLSRMTGARNNNNYSGNNNNNNNNNNFNSYNNGGMSRFLTLPDIILTRNHSELDSISALHPIKETRDDTKASIFYHLKNMDFNLDGTLQQYEDLQAKSSYETKTLSLDSQARISFDASIGLTARLTDRTTNNISGYSSNEKSSAVGARLDFREKNGISQSYRYDNTTQENTFATYMTNRANAGITYRALDSFSLYGELTYSVSDYTPKSDAVGSSPYKQETGGLLFGARYRKEFRPDFLDPFILHANYDFNLGFSKVTSPDSAGRGSGLYYSNSVGAGLLSSGWKTETVSADASYSSKRDQSPAANNSVQQRYALAVTSTRLPRTNIRASMNYSIQDSQINISNVFVQQSSSTQQRRSMIYNVDASHSLNSYLAFNAGASRDHSRSTTATLSMLTVPSESSYMQTMYYGSASFNYMITRNVQYRAEVREEYRINDSMNTDVRAHRLSMNLDYRIRMILIGFEYSLMQEDPSNSPNVTQQTYLAKISRPF